MCLNPIHLRRYNGDIYTHTDIVPCGRCLECQQDKQKNYIQRCFNEGRKTYKVTFFTLTYNNAHVPLMVTRWCVDADGELFNIRFGYKGKPYDPTSHEKVRTKKTYIHPKTGKKTTVSLNLHNIIQDVDACHFTTPFEDEHIRPLYTAIGECRPAFDYNGLDATRECTCTCASLRRRDVRMWLKSSRVAYKREFGEPLPDFKYIIVGEYGSLRGRPHYHGLFFGLDKQIVWWLMHRWEEEYGKTDVKFPETSQDIEATSIYVAKYMTKGVFDKPHISEGVCEVPRVMVSKNLGSLSPAQMSYLRMEDLMDKQLPNGSTLGEFIHDNPALDDINHYILHFNDRTLFEFANTYDDRCHNYLYGTIGETLINQLLQRQYFLINGKKYGLCRFYKNQLYKYEEDSLRNACGKKVCDTEISNALKAIKGVRNLDLRLAELGEIQRQYPSATLIEVCEISEEISLQDTNIKKQIAYDKLKKFYQKEQVH